MAKVPKTSCPRCNSQQSFPRSLREHGTPGVLEVYVRCTMCHWEDVIGHTTKELEAVNARKRKAMQRKKQEASIYGSASTSTNAALHRLIHKSAELTHQLNKQLAK